MVTKTLCKSTSDMYLEVCRLKVLVCIVCTQAIVSNPRMEGHHREIATSIIIGFDFTCLTLGNFTSSTAQGGGGSFKNRKPIGEIGCCESPMAEQKH